MHKYGGLSWSKQELEPPIAVTVPIVNGNPGSHSADQHAAIIALLAVLNEQARRLVAAFLAGQQGRGGITQIARISGLSRNTIRRGLRELTRPDAFSSLLPWRTR
jgi:DNA-binding phage protein